VITRILLCHAPPSSQSEARPSASRNSRNAKQRGWFSAQFHDADQGLQIRTTRDATWQNTLQKLIATERIASIEVCPVKVIGETSAVCCLVAIFRRKFKETRSRHTRTQKATADQDAALRTGCTWNFSTCHNHLHRANLDSSMCHMHRKT
jgi:hypothetical protein